jgi:hypothetical protein
MEIVHIASLMRSVDPHSTDQMGVAVGQALVGKNSAGRAPARPACRRRIIDYIEPTQEQSCVIAVL